MATKVVIKAHPFVLFTLYIHEPVHTSVSVWSAVIQARRRLSDMQHVPVIPDGFGFCVEERLRDGW